MIGIVKIRDVVITDVSQRSATTEESPKGGNESRSRAVLDKLQVDGPSNETDK